MPFPIETKGHYGRERLPMRDSGLRSVLLSSLDLSDTPSVRSVPMIILYISRSEPGVRPYPTPAFTSKRDLEIEHGINVVLLLVEGQPALQRSKIISHQSVMPHAHSPVPWSAHRLHSKVACRSDR